MTQVRYDGLCQPKYAVQRFDRADALGGKHDGCKHFVMDLTHDPSARIAALAYADAADCSRPKLARELRLLVKALPPIKGAQP
jgi:hypothetical protein